MQSDAETEEPVQISSWTDARGVLQRVLEQLDIPGSLSECVIVRGRRGIAWRWRVANGHGQTHEVEIAASHDADMTLRVSSLAARGDCICARRVEWGDAPMREQG